MLERDDETADGVEVLIRKMLLVGVSVSACVVVAGGVLFLVRHGHDIPDFGEFRGEPAELRTFPGILGAAAKLEARAIIQFGLGLLIATPVARVALSLFAFARRRDLLYTAISTLVLAILLFGVLVAHFSTSTSPPASLP
jgi:uncharacterized membrane protein